jgi:hypothetical protein
MESKMETMGELQEIASWRVAVAQGLTLLGFREWLIEHAPKILAEAQETALSGMS